MISEYEKWLRTPEGLVYLFAKHGDQLADELNVKGVSIIDANGAGYQMDLSDPAANKARAAKADAWRRLFPEVEEKI